MNDRFVDTSGWAAWATHNELHHRTAVGFVEETLDGGGRLVTTTYVLAELTALLTSPMRIAKRRQIELLGDLRAEPSVEVVHIDPELEQASWRLWASRPDKAWSFVDCASFVVMSRRGLTEAVTGDRHFEQAGFVRLLK